VFFTGLSKRNLALILQAYFVPKKGLPSNPSAPAVTVSGRVSAWAYPQDSTVQAAVRRPPALTAAFSESLPYSTVATEFHLTTVDLLFVRSVQ
jgi:hypothetical protein